MSTSSEGLSRTAVPSFPFLQVYRRAFQDPGYCAHTTDFRYRFALRFLKRTPGIKTVLDLGSDRETLLSLLLSKRQDLAPASTDLAKFHDLPLPHHNVYLTSRADRERLASARYDVVACLDVLDVIARIAPYAVLTIANGSCVHHQVQLHLMQRRRPFWESLIERRFTIVSTETRSEGALYAFQLDSRTSRRQG